ncbi:C-C motif chemokine 28 isoform X2 [Vulpes lagopus]|uniref:C-C motif chemokine 28 isoform X2 n=1 Tax=Vulpes lagopus TaxID=494514 RepID=UPI001BC9A486|nr:C-C motif chemokine 28 isoform X2 [Vulpes lagopus]
MPAGTPPASPCVRPSFSSSLGSGSSTKCPAPGLSSHTAAMTAAILPIASSCCTEVSHHISRRLLERVNICRIQRADGDCDLAAVILHVRRRRLCVSPHSHVIKQWMKEQAAKKNTKGNICHKKQAGKRKSKGAHQEKPEIHSHKSPY